MRLLRSLVVGLITLSTGMAVAARVHRGPTASHHGSARHNASGRSGLRKASGQRGSSRRGKSGTATAAASRPRAMDDSRATQIQSALVKAGYLQEVTGHWDSSSQAAMQKLQGDNGWQTKMIPDSRALIKLGLGPSATLSKPDLSSGAGGSEDSTVSN